MPKYKVIIVIFQSLTDGSAGGMGALGYDIATGLLEDGHDVFLYTINKGPFETPFPSGSVLPGARVILWGINKLMGWRLISRLSGYKWQERLFDHFLSRKELKADILLTTFPLLPHTLKKARKNIGKIILIPQNPDEQYIYDVCMEEVKKYVLPVKNDAYVDAWRRAQQQKSLASIDEVISISRITHASYNKFQGKKTFISYYLNRTGGNNTCKELRMDKKFIFLFVAHIVILKGLQQLLAAWQKVGLPADAELWIAGNIDPALKERLVELFPAVNVKWLGHQSEINCLIIKASVVIVPSLVDNEPHTAVEALSLKRPLIISDGCGNADWIMKEVPEAVFKKGNIEELEQKIKYVYNHYIAFNDLFAGLYEHVAMNRDNTPRRIDNIVKHIIEN